MNSELRQDVRFEIGAQSLIFCAALAIGFFHVYTFVDLPFVQYRMELHGQILSGVAASPYRYRLFAPGMAQILVAAVGMFVRDPVKAFLYGFRLFDLLAIWGTLVAIYYYLREFFSKSIALTGALAVGGMMVIPLRDHYYQPWSLAETGFFALGLLFLHRRQLLPFLGVLLVATVNREAAVILVVAAIATEFGYQMGVTGESDTATRLRSATLWVGSSLLVWGAVFVGLRLLRGSAPAVDSISALWTANNAAIGRTTRALLAFLGPIWVLAVLGWRWAPRFVKWTAAVIPVHVALYLVFALWFETRILMPLYLIALPLALSFMWGGPDEAAPDVPAADEPGPPAEA